MVVTMPDKALWESAFVFLASWLRDIFTVSLRLRGIMMLQESLQVIVEYTGFHHLTQPLAFMHRICLFVSLYTMKSQDFSLEALKKHWKKARFSLDIPTVPESLKRSLHGLAHDRAFRAQGDFFRSAKVTLQAMLEEADPSPYKPPFVVLLEDVSLLYQDILHHANANGALLELAAYRPSDLGYELSSQPMPSSRPSLQRPQTEPESSEPLA